MHAFFQNKFWMKIFYACWHFNQLKMISWININFCLISLKLSAYSSKLLSFNDVFKFFWLVILYSQSPHALYSAVHKGHTSWNILIFFSLRIGCWLPKDNHCVSWRISALSLLQAIMAVLTLKLILKTLTPRTTTPCCLSVCKSGPSSSCLN